MKKLFLGLAVLTGGLAGIAFASTVTTTDGQNYLVTNDSGYATNMTLNQIMMKVKMATTATSQDSQKLLYDQEVSDIWGSVVQMAQSSLAQWQSQQPVPVVNAVVNSDNSVSIGTEAPAGNMDVGGTISQTLGVTNAT